MRPDHIADLLYDAPMQGSQLIREARRRAGLTQQQLAERAGTTQSAVARWESGRTNVTFDTVRRLVGLCGLELEVAIVDADDSDLAQAEALLRLSPGERLSRGVAMARTMKRLQGIARGA